ncbi:PQQ-binding-like beta-propeller repeat protein [Streptomyces xiangluensis]|uniref:PQQ-binding-like beta-propeller repeat protein n=1 Tax=Streptomyces xiangluensis TaxID=2665720 RepID=A0ABV8YTQ9_9ACTN
MEPLGPDDPEELGPYHLLARLGAGGMGQVYLATSSYGRAVAVKVIRPEKLADRTFRIRFRREVAAAQAVGGRYTVPLVDADPDAATPWLATPYVPGPTLEEAVAEHGPLPVPSVLALGACAAEALLDVHSAGLVHRDLKPSNVLLAADGPRVIDFGIVRANDGYDLTSAGTIFGSLEYMCPEQATGAPTGPAGDIFSLGSVLTYAASGHAPFIGSAAATLLYQVVHDAPDLTGVPKPLNEIISLCLAKDPRHRITADQLYAACAPGGVEQTVGRGWLPAPVASSIARRTAALRVLDTPSRTPSRNRIPVSAHRNGHAPRAYDRYGASSAPPTPPPHHSYDSGHMAEAPAIPRPREPEPAAYPAHRQTPARRRLSRRTILTASAATTTAAVVSTALLVTRGDKADGQKAAEPLGPAPPPLWTYRSDPLVQAPAVFQGGSALLKTRPGNMVCLDLKDGTRPKWVYRGISQSPTPVVKALGAAVALGEGATVIGVDPDKGTERFTYDFGADFRFDTLFGKISDRVITVFGLRLQRRSDEQGVATSTNTVFGIDLEAGRADITPISPEDVGIPLEPVVFPDNFIYADGFRNVTARNTDDGGVRWRHPVGYELRPGLAVLGRTVFAVGRELMALHLATGRLRWNVRAERGQFASLGVAGNTVYATGTAPSGVYAFNAANGSRRWFCPTPRLNTDHPIVAGPREVYVPAFRNGNGFYAIDAARGTLLWNFTDGVETGVHDWQLASDGAGHLVAHHYDRTYGVPTP